jgi:hypothetical protein
MQRVNGIDDVRARRVPNITTVWLVTSANATLAAHPCLAGYASLPPGQPTIPTNLDYYCVFNDQPMERVMPTQTTPKIAIVTGGSRGLATDFSGGMVL